MRVAVVVPRYGAEVLGGAEAQARGFAEEAVRQGWEVEVWTTCARSHYTWENVYPGGWEKLNGVVVRRFPITHNDPARRAGIEIRLATQGYLPVDDQYAWLESGPHSVSLYEYISQHAAQFDVVVALPYALSLIHYAVWSAPERMVVWPCLHNEPYAYLEPVRLLLESCWGVMFYSPEERDLAILRLKMRLHRQGVIGAGVTLSLPVGPLGRRKNSFPYLLYAGRLEEGKNVGLLYEYMRRYVDEKRADLRLVVIGDGPLKPPAHPAFEFRKFVSEEEKAATYASALLLCQPSLNESFSRTIMEAWLAGRPVLVHEDCAVTRGHVERSKGGLWFRSFDEFAEAVTWFSAHPEMANRMGQNGREYVLRNYSSGAVIARFERLVRQWREKVE